MRSSRRLLSRCASSSVKVTGRRAQLKGAGGCAWLKQDGPWRLYGVTLNPSNPEPIESQLPDLNVESTTVIVPRPTAARLGILRLTLKLKSFAKGTDLRV